MPGNRVIGKLKELEYINCYYCEVEDIHVAVKSERGGVYIESIGWQSQFQSKQLSLSEIVKVQAPSGNKRLP